jgi:hypothetical protein
MSVELRDSVSKVFTGLKLKEAGTSSTATHTHIYFFKLKCLFYSLCP